MDWVSNAIALAISIASLIAFSRWLGRQMASTSDPALAPAKRNFVLALVAICALAAIAVVIMLLAIEPDPLAGAMLGMGVFLAGVTPIIYWMILSQVRFMGLEGEGPTKLSDETMRAIRTPMIGGIIIAFAAATLMIWLGGKPEPVLPHEVLALGAVALVALSVAWPLLVLRRCIAEERRRKTEVPLGMRGR